MSDIKPMKTEWRRKLPHRLIYLGNHSRPYGVAERDTFNFDSYLAKVIANGLRMLVAYGHTEIDEEEYERIASKLEFYAMDTDSVIHEHLDWDNDRPGMIGEKDWLSTQGRPAFAEYCDKSAQVNDWKNVYIDEALVWLRNHWGELWD
jgi:hypothetical protein